MDESNLHGLGLLIRRRLRVVRRCVGCCLLVDMSEAGQHHFDDPGLQQQAMRRKKMKKMIAIPALSPAVGVWMSTMRMPLLSPLSCWFPLLTGGGGACTAWVG